MSDQTADNQPPSKTTLIAWASVAVRLALAAATPYSQPLPLHFCCSRSTVPSMAFIECLLFEAEAKILSL